MIRIPADALDSTRIHRVYRFQCRDCSAWDMALGRDALRLAHRFARVHAFVEDHQVEVVRVLHEYERLDR